MIKGSSVTYINPIHTIEQRITKKWIMNKIKYIKGGVTIIYPTKYFYIKPIVQITLELFKSKYSDNIIMSHIITSNSVESTTIRVNYSDGTRIKEIDSDSVLINIYSFDGI